MAKDPRKSRLEAARVRMYRELVFECAEQVFAAKGFDEASMQDIAAEAGVSLKTVYSVVDGKNELYRQIQELRGDQFLEHVAGALESVDGPLDALEQGVRAYVDFLVAHEPFLRIHLRERVAWGLGPGGKGSASGGERQWQQGVSNVAKVLRSGMETGEIYDGDPDMMAMMTIAILQVQLARLTNGAADVDAKGLADEIVVQLHRLLRPPDAG